jgi:hypothetical protein
MGPRTALLAALLLLAGCTVEPVIPDTPAPPYSSARTVDRLAVTEGTMLDLPRGETAELSLSAWFEGDEQPTDVTAAAAWVVGDPSIAVIDIEGQIEGLAEGMTAAWGVYQGISSEPVSVQVTRGLWNVDFIDGGTGVQGKLLDVELVSTDTTFADAEDIVLTIDGLIPFGMDRTDDPWWGVVDGAPNRYRARFLVPPTATASAHAVNITLDGRPPEDAIQVQITSNTAFGEVRDCDYFGSSAASNWTFQADGNNARTWLVGSLGRNTNTRITASSATAGDVNAWLGLWSLTGDLLTSSDDDPSLTLDAAGVQITSLEDVFDGAFYVTASISPESTASEAGGSMVTECTVETMPDPQHTATNDATLFGAEGTGIFPGSITDVATFSSSQAGDVYRAWVYLDVALTQPDVITVRLTSPAGTEVELINPQWSLEWMQSGGLWSGVVGGPAPFIPTADEFTNPSTSDGTRDFHGESAAGTWTVSVEMSAVGTGGTWYDAQLWIEID